MTGLSAGASVAIAKQFPFARHETVLDVGCAEGGFLVQLALAHPHLRGTGFDLPTVREPFGSRSSSTSARSGSSHGSDSPPATSSATRCPRRT